jgi:hypothetical protein
VKYIIALIQKKLKVKEITGDSLILGLKVSRDRDNRTLTVTQENHIETLLVKYGLDKSNSTRTPEEAIRCDYRTMFSSAKVKKPSPQSTEDHDDDPEAVELKGVEVDSTSEGQNSNRQSKITLSEYRNVVGSLQYIATCTRPDIAHAVSALATHCNNPQIEHLKAVARVLRYLRGTTNVGLIYSGKELTVTKGREVVFDDKPMLEMFSDSDWAGNSNHSRSTTGIVAKLAGGPVTWKSKLQTIIALSSTEAEYIAAAEAGRETLWLRNLLEALGCKQVAPTPLLIDNQNAILMVEGKEGNLERRKHIQLRFHWIKQQQLCGNIIATKVPTDLNEADPFTKGLGAQVFTPLIEKMMSLEAQKQLIRQTAESQMNTEE